MVVLVTGCLLLVSSGMFPELKSRVMVGGRHSTCKCPLFLL